MNQWLFVAEGRSQRIGVGSPRRLGSIALISLAFQRRHKTLQPQPVA